MEKVQDRVLNQIGTALANASYESAVSFAYTNTGNVHVFEKGATVACGSISFEFQTGNYILTITWHGKPVPSQLGRDNYFSFYQGYAEKTRFWDVLGELIGKPSVD